MTSQHTAEDLAFLAAFEPTVSVDVDGLGPTCFSHGSPRSDEECVTEQTPRRAGARVHGRVTRGSSSPDTSTPVRARGRRSPALSPGSVGLPYGDVPAAYWALLGPDVELRRTSYDVDAAVAAMRATDDPRVETVVELMLQPPSRDEVIEDAERRVFAG